MKRNIFILLGTIGNGYLGAMVFGKPDDEMLQLNDNTLYSGEPSTAWKGLDITQTYDEALALLRAEKYAEATDFLQKNWLGRLHQNYQPLGDWHLIHAGRQLPFAYLRTCFRQAGANKRGPFPQSQSFVRNNRPRKTAKPEWCNRERTSGESFLYD
jgi:hypothetical protein